MATVITICNTALARLGDVANITSIEPPEGGAQSEHCARFYPIARDTLLSQHAWTFARKNERLSLLSLKPNFWQHAFAAPVDLLTLLDIVDQHQHRLPHSVESNGKSNIILCNAGVAYIKYTAQIKDPLCFPPLFVEALTWQLASMLAGPLIKGDVGAAEAKRCLQMVQVYTAQANFNDANQDFKPMHHDAPWVMGR